MKFNFINLSNNNSNKFEYLLNKYLISMEAAYVSVQASKQHQNQNQNQYQNQNIGSTHKSTCPPAH